MPDAVLVRHILRPLLISARTARLKGDRGDGGNIVCGCYAV